MKTKNGAGTGKPNFREWEAAELFCPRCRKAAPVKKRMLLALPDGDKYEYVCAFCGEVTGKKFDRIEGNFQRLIE